MEKGLIQHNEQQEVEVEVSRNSKILTTLTFVGVCIFHNDFLPIEDDISVDFCLTSKVMTTIRR